MNLCGALPKRKLASQLEDLSHTEGPGPHYAELEVLVPVRRLLWVRGARPAALSLPSTMGSPLLEVSIRQAVAHLLEDLEPFVVLKQPFLAQA